LTLFESTRLKFRKLEPEDATRLFALHSDERVTRYLGLPDWHSEQDSLNYIFANLRSYASNGFGRWVVSDKAGNDFVGLAGLIIDPHDGFVDLGYRFFPDYWGRGYATESAKAVVDKGFSDWPIETVEARVAIGNTASERVLEKIGMEFTGTGSCMGIRARAYRLSREDWQSLT